MKAKSYNPFKMWGSWVGAGIGLIPLLSLMNILYLNFLPKIFGLLFMPEAMIAYVILVQEVLAG